MVPATAEADRAVNIPFAFYSEFFGAAAGLVAFKPGYPQPQARVLGTVMAGSKGSVMGFFMGRDIQMPGTERLFVDPWVSLGSFSDNRAYVNGNPAYPEERSGSNDSHSDNYLKGNGRDLFTQVRFKYLLPIGHGRKQTVASCRFEDGLPVSGATGGESWNPLESGRTFLELQPSAPDRRPGISHLGVHVENIRATLARLGQHGVTVEEPRVSRTNSTIANATGPDGVRIELSELGPESLQRKAINSWK